MITELIIAGVSFFHPQSQRDSLGIETINGKVYVIHKVDEKETLFAISRRYNASVEAILQSNPGVTANLEVGQILKVPYTQKPVTKPGANEVVHAVAAKETMYSISKLYSVTVDEIKQWNKLADNSLSIGQEIIIRKQKDQERSGSLQQTPAENTERKTVHTVAAKETMFSIARQYGVTIQQLKEWNKFENEELKIGQEIYVMAPLKKSGNATERFEQTENARQTEVAVVQAKKEETNSSEPVKIQQPIKISESVKNSDEVIESGLAELIEGTEGNRKYLALHRTAPVGSILKVRNEMNNREVFVRVTGKLQENALNEKLVIKISKSAYDRLGAIDPRFRVEITYYK